jgi:hypothetical protein
MYVVSTNKDPNNPRPSAYSHWLHALDIITGQEMLGGPVKISAQYNGTASDSINGIISLVDHRQLQRSALLLNNGKIYISFASYGDQTPAHGWILAYDANTLNQVAVLNTTPDAVTPTIGLPGMGTIWQGGQGPASDGAGNVYFMSGNGDFSGSSDPMPRDLGDCIVKLSPSLQLLDWFSPHNNASLDLSDTDLGAGGVLLIPGTNLLAGCGKEAVMYLANTNNLGHFNTNNDNQLVQPPFSVIMPSDPPGSHEVRGGPVYWSSQNGKLIYVSPVAAPVKAFELIGGIFQPTSPVSQSDNSMGAEGGWMSLSSNGMTPETGILWVSEFTGDLTDGMLHAYNAENLQQELWNSGMNAPRDSVGQGAKFCPPTIANGKVYLATFSGYLAVYGLIPHSIPASIYPLLF